jgi:diguanylate cyclase (GGDEF)-like protein
MDRLTLLSMQGGLLAFMGVVIFLAWRTQRRPYSDNGPVWFSIGYVVGGIGLYLQAYRGIIPAFFAIILGNFLFLMTYVFMERAVAITTHRRSYMQWLLGANVVFILNYVYFTYFKPDVIVRTIEAVIIMPAMQIPIWIHLVRCKEKTIRPALQAMSAVLVVHMMMNFVRVVGVLTLHKADAWFTWTGVITIAGLSISFMWIDSLRIREELERRAMTDPLTGLLNRRGLDELGTRELSRARRLGLPCSALALDLNYFKQINDTYGHVAGDDALCAVAVALRSSLRITDVATRIGGDEFFVILPGSDEQSADEICERLRATIHGVTLETAGGQSFSITLSIGCTTLRGEDMTIADLLRESDAKLYGEKESLSGR